jgi:hypothetical protein
MCHGLSGMRRSAQRTRRDTRPSRSSMKSTSGADLRVSRAECCPRCTPSGTRSLRARCSLGRASTCRVSAWPPGRHCDADGLCARSSQRSPARPPPLTDGSRVGGRTPRGARRRARLRLSRPTAPSSAAAAAANAPGVYAAGVSPFSRGPLAARLVVLTPRYARSVASERSNRGLQSVELNDERVRAGLARLDEMIDVELRELVRGEPSIFVEAAEGIIARRRSDDGLG